MNTIYNKINKGVKILIAVFFILFILKTISTYYSSLGQYGTGDQTQFSLPRIQKFLASSDSVILNEGSNLSYIFVAYPGHSLEKYLDKSHKKQDKLYEEIQYTEVLPYSFIQVTLSIIIIFYCVFLIGRLLSLNLKRDYLFYLLIAIILLNYPTLKGDIKVLKYDALSLLCSISAIINYLIYCKENKRKFLIFASVLSAFAFIEKDTCFSSIILIIFFEIINLVIRQEKTEGLLKKILYFIVFYIAIILITIFIMIPQLWHDPGKLSILFKGLNDYFQALSFGTVFFGLIFGIGILLLIRFYIFKNNTNTKKITKTNTKQKANLKVNPNNVVIQNKLKHEELYYVLLILGFIIFISALLYQRNNMIDISTASPQMLNKIKTEKLFVSPEMAQVSISTLDKSEWVTRLKIFYNSLRIFIYVTPEIIVLLFFFAPLFLIIGHKKGAFSGDKYLLNIMFLFPVFLMLAYSYLLAPIEPKYNLLSYLLLIIFSIFIMVKTLQNSVNSKYVPVILLGISLLMIRPAILAEPAHFGYKNYFRSVKVENTEFLDLNKYNWWMWLGWGETTYPCFKYIDKTTTGTQKILLDYTPPFAENLRLQPRYNPYFRQTYVDTSSRAYLKFDVNEFKGFINFYKNDSANKVDYLLISKNVANRGIIGNFIVKNYRDKAVFVDKIGGIEYGWLFKIEDLYNSVK